jgi:GH15 family glucan-1,4-alpha-glucosidase
MCQVALDRAAAIADRIGLSGSVARWRSEAADLRDTILTPAWNEDAKTLVATPWMRASWRSRCAVSSRPTIPK